MKLWVDDMRPAPGDCFHEWAWCKAVNTAKTIIEAAEKAERKLNSLTLTMMQETTQMMVVITSSFLIG